MTPRVLCIEDQPDNMTLVRRILQSESYTLIEAKTGFQGLAIAENEDVDIILLDINLPDIDGYEIARRVRASSKEKLANIPIIIVTANAMRGDAQKAYEAGGTLYMTKPINIQDLMEKVRNLANKNV